MGLSMMCVAILLSYHGTSKERVTANASIAFFVTVSQGSVETIYHTDNLLVHDLLRCEFERHSMAVLDRDTAYPCSSTRNSSLCLQQLDLGKLEWY